MGKARAKLSGSALADFNAKHPHGLRGRFVKKGAQAAQPVAPEAPRGRARAALRSPNVARSAAPAKGGSLDDRLASLRRDLPKDGRERVEQLLAPLKVKELDALAVRNGWTFIRGNKAERRRKLVDLVIGARLDQRAIRHAILGTPSVDSSQSQPSIQPPAPAPAKRRLRDVLKATDLRTADLAGFKREPLRRAARDRFILLRRGASEGTIARALAVDVRLGRPAGKAVGRAAAPGVPSSPRGKNRFHRDISGDMAELADTIENEPVVKKKSLAGGAVGDTRLVEYANGKKVVRKEAINQFGQNTPQMQADAEQLSSLVLRALGLRAPRVYRSDRDGAKVIHMEYVDKAKAPSPWRDTLQDTDEGRVMALADTLIINGDRHHGNWFIKDGHIVPIDNGLAFDEKYFHAIRAGWHVPRGHFSKSDIAEVRARLEKLKPDFELVGRADWHQKMMQRLDRQEHRASASGPSRLLPVLH